MTGGGHADASVLRRRWDVVVIGAGPAGSTAARILAARGHAVLLVDRSDFPRDKVCGDGLIPDALRCLRRAGLYETVARQGFHTDTLSIFSPSGVRVDLPGEFVTLPRMQLDTLLLRAAVECGAVFHAGRVTALSSQRHGVQLRFRDSATPVQARYAVLATGADASLHPGTAGMAERRADAVALRCYVDSPVGPEELIISFDRSILPGYAWIFPLGRNRYNIGCGVFHRGERHRRVNLRRTFAAFTQRFEPAREVWSARQASTSLLGATLRCGLEPRWAYDGGNVVAAGEVIATTFPFTGEGFGKAMESAEAAAEHLAAALAGDADALAAYPRILHEAFRPRYTGYQLAEHWIASPWVSDLVARGVRRSERLRRAAAGVISESVDPRTVFSVRALAAGLLPWPRLR
jgi:geranylgeranyl reductase family protein